LPDSLKQKRLGEFFIVTQAIFWGLFPVLANKSNLPALFSAGTCNILSVILLLPIALRYRIEWHKINKQVLFNLLMTTFVLGFGFTALVFMANQNSDPVTISILLLGEVPATFLILALTGHERFSFTQVLGGLLVVLSSILVIFDGDFKTSSSDLLIVLAVISAPLANRYGKHLGDSLKSTQILAFRNFFGGILLILLSLILEPAPHKPELLASLPYLLPNAFLIFGLSKILWMEGIFRMEVGKAISLGSIFPIVTMIAAYILIGTAPDLVQVLAIFPGLIGVYLVTRK
jgi:drug/metabolite transporter (DMT)-like permease